MTLNAKDFPQEKLPTGLDVLSPAVFTGNTVSLDPPKALMAVAEIARRSGRSGPRLTVEAILDRLADVYGLDDAVATLRQVQ